MRNTDEKLRKKNDEIYRFSSTLISIHRFNSELNYRNNLKFLPKLVLLITRRGEMFEMF